MPDWDCHAVPGERSARATSFYRLPAATEDVLSGKPDVLLGDAAAKAAQRATRTVPIIFIGSGRRSHSSLARRQRDWFTVMEPSLGAKLPGILSRSRHTSPAL